VAALLWTGRPSLSFAAQIRPNRASSQLWPVHRASLRPNTYARPYPEQSPKRLTKRIPELRSLRTTKDQSLLPTILEKTGQVVADFFRNMVDIAAHEDVRQDVLGLADTVLARQDSQYDYVILARDHAIPAAFEEYRTDPRGLQAEQDGVEQGYAITTGFVLKPAYFLPDLRRDSSFRYLGEQMLGSRQTYVVAFAQRPENTTFWGTAATPWGRVRVLDQGIAWIDQNTFQIVRLRTDLLAAHDEVGLAEQTTEITFGEVRIADVSEPLWLPSQVSVCALYHGQTFRNEHRYTQYQRFRVQVLVGHARLAGQN
jgi:hypothetical protein